MKSKLLMSVLIICLIFPMQIFAKSTLKGNTFTDFGKYEVFQKDDGSNNDFKTFEIKYENCDESFTVMVCKGEKCKNYIVYGNNMELQYQCKKGVFGIKKIEKEYRKPEKGATSERIDREQYFRQRVISANAVNEKEHLGLIACYLPQVLKK